MSHGFSPTMQRLLDEMHEREDQGWYLRGDGYGWWWTRGPTSQPVKGLRDDTVGACARRGAITRTYDPNNDVIWRLRAARTQEESKP